MRAVQLLFLSVFFAVISAGEISARRTPVVEAVRKSMPWVVNIGTEKQVRRNDPYFRRLNDFWGIYYKRIKITREYYPLGSGIIVHESGLVLTNWHVARGADNLILKPASGDAFPANVVGFDEQSDLCLLKMTGDFTGKTLEAAKFALPDDLLPGETVITLGNPYGLENSVSQGLLSAINRNLSVTGDEYNDILQTDAAINPGNSGGPLVNLDGEVIGINQAVRSDAQGIGFAIPVKRMENFLSRWLFPETFSNGSLGFKYLPAGGDESGVSVTVEKGGAAFAAGLRDGDVVTAVNGNPVSRMLDLGRQVWNLKPGDGVRLAVRGKNDVSYTLPAMSGEKLTALRLGFRVQKLTRSLNAALEIDEDLQGLAINEVFRTDEYRGDSPAVPNTVSRGDLLLKADNQVMPDVPALLALLENKKSGDSLLVEMALQDNRGFYRLQRFTIILR